MKIDKLLEMSVESRLVIQKDVDEGIHQCHEHLNFEHFTETHKAKVAQILKNIEQIKVGSRIWEITFTEHSWTDNQFSFLPIKGCCFSGMECVTFTITEYNDELEINGDLSDSVIPFFAKRGKVLNLSKIIDFIKQLSKIDKNDEQNHWYINNGEYVYYCPCIKIDDNGDALGYKIPDLNIYTILQ